MLVPFLQYWDIYIHSKKRLRKWTLPIVYCDGNKLHSVKKIVFKTKKKEKTKQSKTKTEFLLTAQKEGMVSLRTQFAEDSLVQSSSWNSASGSLMIHET